MLLGAVGAVPPGVADAVVSMRRMGSATAPLPGSRQPFVPELERMSLG